MMIVFVAFVCGGLSALLATRAIDIGRVRDVIVSHLRNKDPWRSAPPWALELREMLSAILPVPMATVKLALEIPSLTRKGIVMPNYELPNDVVATITIKTTDSGGDVVPVGATDVFTVVSSSPSLGAVIGKDVIGNPAVILTPMVKASPNITITVSDSAGLAQAVQLVDIVPDVRATNLILDLVDATQVQQALPAAPGP